MFEPIVILIAMAGITFVGYIFHSIRLLKVRARWIGISLLMFVAILVGNRLLPVIEPFDARRSSDGLDSPQPLQAQPGWQMLADTIIQSLDSSLLIPQQPGSTRTAPANPVNPDSSASNPGSGGTASPSLNSPAVPGPGSSPNISSPTPTPAPSSPPPPDPSSPNSTPDVSSPAPNSSPAPDSSNPDLSPSSPVPTNPTPSFKKSPVSAWW